MKFVQKLGFVLYLLQRIEMTQQECKREFINLCHDIIKRIENIDKETPSEPVSEPKWWQEMMVLRNNAQSIIDYYKV
jgi:hypothetical protein